MSVETWLAFTAACVVVLVIPGPTILTVISYSVTSGPRARVPLVAAVALGDSTALFLSLIGLGAVLATSAFMFTVIKWLGGLYLMFIGVKMLRSSASLPLPCAAADRVTTSRLFLNTYAVTALNPKGIIFFVAFLPQFLHPESDVTKQLWVFATTFVVLATLNATLYAMFAASARRFLSTGRAQRRFNLLGGSLLTAAGVWALLAKRATPGA